MATAGLEGGCRRAIEDEYTWSDWMEASDAWERTAPPTHYSAMRIAMSLGAMPEPTKPPVDLPPDMPSIAEIAAMARPLGG